MIIGHYDSELWARGGVANYVKKIGQAQQADGHQVYYFSLPSLSDLSNIPFSPFIVVANQEELFTQAAAFKLDILHVHKTIDSSLADNLPIIRTVHGHHPYCPSGGQYLQRWNRPCERTYSLTGCLWGYLFDRCGSIRPHNLQDNFRHTQAELKTLPTIPTITVSQFLRERMIVAGYPADLIQTLHLFADPSADYIHPPKATIPHFLFLGRITPQKGLDWLLKAIAKVHEPIHLDVAGEGENLEQAKQLARQLGIDQQVTFHGWVDSQTIQVLMQQSLAVVFPSVWHEPGGTIAFEAMANARAVVMSQVGGMPEVIHHEENGLLVMPNDIKALAKAMMRLMNDHELATQLGLQGRKTLENQFTLDKHVEKLMNFYKDTIKDKK